MAAVLDRYGTGPRSFGAACWIPGVKTDKTAKKRRKKRQKWARYSRLKRVRVADLFLMYRYKAKLKRDDFYKMAPLHPKLIAAMEQVLHTDIPKLMAMLPDVRDTKPFPIYFGGC